MFSFCMSMFLLRDIYGKLLTKIGVLITPVTPVGKRRIIKLQKKKLEHFFDEKKFTSQHFLKKQKKKRFFFQTSKKLHFLKGKKKRKIPISRGKKKFYSTFLTSDSETTSIKSPPNKNYCTEAGWVPSRASQKSRIWTFWCPFLPIQ